MNIVQQDPLISIIVPVYNVAPYLEQCLDSILSQSYTNLEIIVINDGSTDHGGSICDAYGQKDPRVKVFHQENQGLSETRNAGLEVITGDYILFVDSDDWLEPHMVQSFLTSMEKNHSDLVICAYNLCKGEKKELMGVSPVEKCDSLQALLYLFEDDWLKNFSWNKFYKREFFATLRFPTKCNLEDIRMMYTVFEQAATVSFVQTGQYNYRVRATSVIGSRNLTHEMDACGHHRHRLEDLQHRRAELTPHLWRPLVRCLMHTIFIGVQNPKSVQIKERPRRMALTAFFHAHKQEAFAHLSLPWRCMYTLIMRDTKNTDYVIAACTFTYKATQKVLRILRHKLS